MREEGRISLAQFATLLTAYLIGRSTLIMPVEIARQDGWLAILLGGLCAAGVFLLWLALGLRFQGLSPVDYTRRVLGNFFGIPVVVLYLWFFLHVGAGVARNFGELYATAIMPKTPIVVFIGMLAFLTALTVRGGLEVITRLAELLLPWLVLSVVGLNILTFATPGLMHWEYLEPILGSGWLNVLRGTLLSFIFPYGEAVVFLIILPFLTQPDRTRPYALGSLGFVTLLLALTHLRNLAVLGPVEIARLNLPSLAAIKLINLGEFLQRLDALAVFIWTFGTFLKTAVLQYTVCLGSAELLGLKDYRPLAFPVTLLMTSLAIIIYENFAQMRSVYSTIYPFYALPFTLLLPALTYLAAVVRDLRAEPNKGKKNARE